MQDRLAVVVRRRAVLVVVEPADDHRRVDVAVEELDEHELADRGDARAPDPPGRDRHAAEHDAGVAQDDRARVVVAVAVARVRVLLLDGRELGRAHPADLLADDLLDALEQRERHVSALREQEQRRVAARLHERWRTPRTSHEPFSVSSGADATATVAPTAAFGAPGTSSRAVRPPSFALRDDRLGRAARRVGAAERAELDEERRVAACRRCP